MFDRTAPLAPPVRIVLGVFAGIVATRLMDVAMARLPEGETAPRVAAGVLTGRSPADAPARLARVVHGVAGSLTGGLYVTLLLLAEAVLGPSAGAHLLAAGSLLVLMVGFFGVVVLPRAEMRRDRLRPTVRDWTAVAATYVLVLSAVTWAVTAALLG